MAIQNNSQLQLSQSQSTATETGRNGDQPTILTICKSGPDQAGKAGEGGNLIITNTEFIAEVFRSLPEGAFAAVCSKPGEPDHGGWLASRADQMANDLPTVNNNYIGCSSFYLDDNGLFKARKAQFAACHFLMLDDLGTKIPLALVDDFHFSWLIETSPGNYQGGIIFAEPLTDGPQAEQLLNAIIKAGLCDSGSTAPLTRWARLPMAINGKKKYRNEKGEAFECRLSLWQPNKRYLPEELVNILKLELSPTTSPSKAAIKIPELSEIQQDKVNVSESILTPRAPENPVISALKARGLYKTPLGSGKHDITCPWVHEHTEALDSGSAYFEPDELYPVGGFCCQHSHRDKYHIQELLKSLNVRKSDARHKPVIRVVPGDLHCVVDAAEKELASRGQHYQAGGLIVSISTDPVSGDPSIVPTSLQALTRELSVTATWEKYDARTKDWVLSRISAFGTNFVIEERRFSGSS